jgi:ATP-dependent DNA helicase RecG
MSRGSIINPLLTLDYMQTENENKFFDRKSGKIRPADLAQHIYAASGQFIMVRMFDDRLEIESPGRFPGFFV